MERGGGHMSHKKHRLSFGRSSRSNVAQRVGRDLEELNTRVARRSPMFDSVAELFGASRARRRPGERQEPK